MRAPRATSSATSSRRWCSERHERRKPHRRDAEARRGRRSPWGTADGNLGRSHPHSVVSAILRVLCASAVSFMPLELPVTQRIRVAIAGGSGYGGAESLRWLAEHPVFE